MNTVQRLAKNTSVLLIGNVVQRLLHLVFIMFFVRWVGSAGYGKYSFAISLAYISNVLVSYGLDSYLVREISKNKEDAERHIGEVLSLRILMAGACLLLISFVYGFLLNDYKDSFWIIFIISSYTFLQAISMTFVDIFRANEKMEYESLINVIYSVFFVGLGLLGVLLKLPLIQIILLLTISYVIKFILSYLLSRKFIERFKFSLKDLHFKPSLFKKGFPFLMLSAGTVIFSNTDRFMIGTLSDYAAVGWYAGALKIIKIAFQVVIFANVSIYPILSSRYETNRTQFKQNYLLLFNFFLLFGSLVGIGFALFAKEVVRIILGNGFNQSAFIIWVLLPYIIWNFPNFINGKTMLASQNEGLQSKVILGTAVANIFLNLAFIRAFGYIGAAYATLLSTGFGFTFFSIYLRNRLGIEKKIVKYSLFLLYLASLILFITIKLQNTPLSFRIILMISLTALTFWFYTILDLMSCKYLKEIVSKLIPDSLVDRELGKFSGGGKIGRRNQ